MPDDDAPAAPDRHLEVETKLDVGAGFQMPRLADDAALRSAGVVSAGRPVVHRLDAVYYDTGRLDLLRSRLTLRRRAGGVDAGWHLKLPAGEGARTEVRLPLSGNGSGSDEVPAALAGLLRGAARGRPLIAVARLVTRRTARHLLDEAGRPLVEIADDEVTGTVLLPGGPGQRRWRELEVELDGGTPELLAAVVDTLLTAGARPAAAASKVGRLLAGPASAEPTDGSRGGNAADTSTGASAVTVPTGRDPSAGAVVVTYLARQRDALIDADIRLRFPDPDAEAPHDARAAARRIRSVLRVYRTLLSGPAASSVASRLQALGRAVSEVRDLDVMRARRTLQPGDDAVAGLQRRLADRRASRVAALHRELSGGEYLRLLRDLDSLVADPPLTAAAGAPPPSALGPLVAAAWSRLRRDAEAAMDPAGSAGEHAALGNDDTADDVARHAIRAVRQGAAVHRVRKDAKTVRYAADAAGGAGGAFGDALQAFAAEVERVQDVLGAHQDSVTARALIESLAAETALTVDERGLLGRWARAEAAESARTLAAFADLWPSLPLTLEW